MKKENIWSVCGSGCYLVVLGKYKAVMVGTWWYWVRTRQYWLVLCGTGSLEVEGSTACYLVVLGQKRALLVASVICFRKISGLHGLNHQIIQCWFSRERYCLVLGGTGSKLVNAGRQCDMLSEDIWFALFRLPNY